MVLALFLTFSTKTAIGQHEDTVVSHAAVGAHHQESANDATAPVDIAAVAMEHIADSHTWHRRRSNRLCTERRECKSMRRFLY